MSRLRSLPAQVLLGALLGIGVGLLLPAGALPGLGEIGKTVIHWVKLVAGPFLFLTVAREVLVARIGWSQGVRLVAIALSNTAVALAIGIGLALLFLRGGTPVAGIAANASPTALPSAALPITLPTALPASPPAISLGLDGWTKTFTPPSLFSPFVQNEILVLALLALVLGIAVRRSGAFSAPEIARLRDVLEKGRAVLSTLLHGLVRLIPFAVFGVLVSTVAKHGLGVFVPVSKFVAVVLAGMILQVVLVYGAWLFLVARRDPREFWRAAKTPILYAWGVNSSLATLPLTLQALRELRVSDRSASLGAGVATNLNNDGIVLYEAMAVFFIAFAAGIPMDVPTMVFAALTCVVAAMGITGIPEAGFISLSVVVGVLALPTELLPLLLAVDWVVARFRSVVNVLSDLTLSIALEAVDPPSPDAPAPSA